MSSALAIAAVTNVLVAKVQQALQAIPPAMAPDAQVTVGPPQVMREGKKDAQLNLFLYQVLPSATWRNQDMPGKVKPGERAFPLLGLKLCYLVTAFGNESDSTPDTSAERLLGKVMLKFHTESVLGGGSDPSNPSNIDLSQFELVRLSWQPLSLDEMSKIWSAFQSPYRLSVGYEASVVLIESGKPSETALPVLSRGGAKDEGFQASATVGTARITGFRLPRGATGVRPGDTLVIQGEGLDDPNLFLEFRHTRLAPQRLFNFPRPRTSSEVLWTVPEDPTAWPAGPYLVAAGRRIPATNIPGGDDHFHTTEAFPFAVLPRVRLSPPALRPRMTVTRDADPTVVKRVVVEFELAAPPLSSPDDGKFVQQVRFFAGRLEIPGSYSFASDGHTVRLVVDDAARVLANLYRLIEDEGESNLVRVQVDGVDSSLIRLPLANDQPLAFDQRLTLEIRDPRRPPA